MDVEVSLWNHGSLNVLLHSLWIFSSKLILIDQKTSYTYIVLFTDMQLENVKHNDIMSSSGSHSWQFLLYI